MMQELSYIRCGDYYIPDIRLPKETRPIGRWGRMHRDYIKEHNPIRFNDLLSVPIPTVTTAAAMFMYTSLSILCELKKFRSCRIWTDHAIPDRA